MSSVPQTIGVLIPAEPDSPLQGSITLNTFRFDIMTSEIQKDLIDVHGKHFFVFYDEKGCSNKRNSRATDLTGYSIFGDVLFSTCSHEVVSTLDVQEMIEINGVYPLEEGF